MPETGRPGDDLVRERLENFRLRYARDVEDRDVDAELCLASSVGLERGKLSIQLPRE